MVPKDITFTDVDGETVTEKYYFSVDEEDAADLEVIHQAIATGDPDTHLRKIFSGENTRALLDLWRELLMVAVAKREGKLLVKDPEVKRHFRYGGAYKKLFSEIVASEDAGAAFFMEILPGHVVQQAKEQVAQDYSNTELLAMSDDDFYKAAGTTDIRDMNQRFMTLAMQRRNNENLKKTA
jgi:hypothetical protein